MVQQHPRRWVGHRSGAVRQGARGLKLYFGRRRSNEDSPSQTITLIPRLYVCRTPLYRASAPGLGARPDGIHPVCNPSIITHNPQLQNSIPH